jgi:tetratricopeptide (TPR) repeat protein
MRILTPALAILVGLTAPTLAADNPAAPVAPAAPAATADKPKPPETRADKLDWLYGRLAKTTTEDAGKRIASQITAIMLESGSDTTDLLMSRALKAMAEKDWPLALDLLDEVVTLQPDYVEGWNKRATVFFTTEEYGKALADIEHVLALEPRHFGALSGLGLILNELDDKKRAAAVFARLLQIYPTLESAKKAAKELDMEKRERDI